MQSPSPKHQRRLCLARLCRCRCDIDALAVLDFHGLFGVCLYKHLEKICDAVDEGRAGEGFDQACLIVKVGCDDLDALVPLLREAMGWVRACSMGGATLLGGVGNRGLLARVSGAGTLTAGRAGCLTRPISPL